MLHRANLQLGTIIYIVYVLADLITAIAYFILIYSILYSLLQWTLVTTTSFVPKDDAIKTIICAVVKDP